MTRTPILAAFLVAITACASAPAPKTKVGWDEHADFSQYHTWAWKADGSIRDATWARRCQSVLSDELTTKKLTETGLDQNPDLWAVVHARLSTETQVVSYSPAWGYGWGPYGSAWAYDETVAYQIPVGSLVIDLVDAKQKQIVWRGRANGEIQADKTNEEREEKLIGILQELFASYPPPSPPK